MAVNLSRQATGWTELRPYLPARARLRMALIGLTAFLGSLSESLTLVLVTLTADSLIRTVEVVELGPLELTRTQAVLLATAMVLVRVSMTTLSAALSARFSSLAMRNAQSRLVRAYLEGSHVARSARQVGDLSAVAVTNGRFTADMANSYTLVAAGVCGLLAFGGTSLVVSPLATLAISVLGGLLLVVLRPLRTRSKRASKRLAETNRGLATSITETETLHREIEVFDAGDAVQEQLRPTIGENAERYERVRFLAAAVPQVFQASMLGAAVLSLLVVVRNPEAVDLASIGAVVLLLIRSMSAAQQLVMANQKVIEFGAYVHSLAELVDVLEASRPAAGEARPAPMVPLRLDRVSFTYDGESNVLEDLDLTLSAGDLVGVVGPSGAGKSTFVELLLRLRRPTAGTVQFGGVDAVDVERGHYAGKVAFVPQHPAVIRGTVAENVAFHRDIDEDRIRTALRLAHLEREVDALPEGIHTRLGPDDRALSGGQRQRLTIARAVAGDPEVVVLDEPTSALDAVSEEAIRELLDELRQDRVVIVVAHRYSTLRSCSRILVLQDGRLQMDADPAEVARHSEFFQTMVGDAVT